jgi:hypothetical protein
MVNDESRPASSTAEDSHPEDELDHCVCDVEIGEDEVTGDNMLPAAEGGVATSQD